MRIYVAGPVTGIAEWNAPAFAAETARLRALGHEVVSPLEINHGREQEGWHACMRRDIVRLVSCEAVQLLPGYENSKGVAVELGIARGLDMRIFHPASALLEA